MNPSTKSKIVLYQNIPQLKVNLIDAKKSYHVMGRGLGKTTEILAPKGHRCMSLMPRSAGINVAESYMQLLDRTLPPMLQRWQEMGLKRDVDFWVRRFPPKNIGLNMPYIMPETAEHAVFVRVNRRDVSVMKLVSQDRPSSASGMSVDWILGDEVKFLNKEELDRGVMLTNRGNRRYFDDCYLHHSVTFTTDMPTSSSGKWIHEIEELMEPDLIELILVIQQEIFQIKVKAKTRGRFTKQEETELAYYQKELNKLRKEAVYYSEASTLDNIDVLGAEFIRDLKRTLPDFIFRTSVLNEKPGKAEHTFYPDLADRHFYNAIDYSFADGLPESSYGKGKMKDCRKDSDLDRGKPLEIALDVGGRINVLSAGQGEGRQLGILNGLHVVEPGKNRMKHLAVEFDNYYKYFYKKEVIIYYDHTHIAANSVSDKNPLDEFCDELTAKGWEVTRYNVGITPSFRNRYIMWGLLLNGRSVAEGEFFTVMFNKANTTTIRTAMECTKTLLGGKTGFEKDKRVERDEKANQLEAPHFSDATDLLVYGMIKRRSEFMQYSSSLISL